jgi:catechol 2,3-dioxygenase-like lactoylglutathione lyase family enzyme
MNHSVTLSMPAIKGMCPYIEVFDMPASLQFYRDILGFQKVQSSGDGDDVDWVLLQLDDIELMLNTAYEKEYRPSQPDVIRNKGHEDMAFFFGCPDIEAMYNYLMSKSVTVRAPFITGYGWKAITLKDPDNYALWFHWPVGS